MSLIALAIVAAGCGVAAGTPPDGLELEAADDGTSGGRYDVLVDGPTGDFTGSFHRFFPSRLAVSPGDTVVFRRPDNGEPHTVTLATEPPRRQAVPGGAFFEGGFGGPPRVDTTMPCVLAQGSPPAEGCTAAQRALVPFDGTQSWFNSGGMLDDDEFALELSPDAPPGSYLFVCLVHTPAMQVTLDVVAPGQAADDPVDVVARGDEELRRARDSGQTLVDDPPTVIDGQVNAAAADLTFTVWANTFAPEETRIPAGGTVTWVIRGLHTISFNAPESARPLYQRAADGSVAENPLGGEPQGDANAWDGSGVLGSGLREGLFPPDRFSVTFTEPGTYPYRCLVHFDMQGKVKVGA